MNPLKARPLLRNKRVVLLVYDSFDALHIFV